MFKAIGLVKVIRGEGSFWQTEVVPLTVADGVGRTVIVVDPDME